MPMTNANAKQANVNDLQWLFKVISATINLPKGKHLEKNSIYHPQH